ncbi:DUF4252 domain-containing protein [Flavobacterium sp. 3HN19-14]|uniref:DUF4252 domain-containing protein n=1 Tax=Flavobacterium sp. 3HN19-14 TaxID=3448133 RepID=UPI003EE1A9C3
MIGGLDSKDKESQQYMNLVKKLDNLRVFTTDNSKYAADMKATADKYIKSAGLEELMRVNDKGQSVKIMIKSGSKDSQVRELLMFIEGAGKNNQTVLLSLTGNFDLNELSTLTDKMNLPGGDSLKKPVRAQNKTKMKKIYILALISGLFLTGCNSGPSLQKYFVENTENKNFIVVDVAPGILQLDKSKLTVEQAEALASFEKINVLAFKLDSTNVAQYDVEKTKVKEILKDKNTRS